LQWFSNVFQAFSQVFQTLVLSVSFVFFCILQLLYMNVSKVNRILHVAYTWEAADGVDDVRGGVDDVGGGAGLLLVHSLASPTRYALVCSLYAAAPGR
jgi:hypothetical protein